METNSNNPIQEYHYDLFLKLQIENIHLKYHFKEKCAIEFIFKKIIDSKNKENYYDNAILITEFENFLSYKKLEKDVQEILRYKFLQCKDIYFIQNYLPKLNFMVINVIFKDLKLKMPLKIARKRKNQNLV